MATKKKKVKNATRPQIIEASERRNYVLEQRKGGSSYRVIATLALNRFGAERLPKNYDARYAHDDVAAELKRIQDQTSDDAKEVQTMELERLDRMQAAIWEDVLGSAAAARDAAIDRMLRIMKRRAELLGLDAPAKSDFTSGGDKVQTVIYLPDNGRADPQCGACQSS